MTKARAAALPSLVAVLAAPTQKTALHEALRLRDAGRLIFKLRPDSVASVVVE